MFGIGNLFQGPQASDILKAITNPIGTAGAGVGKMLKQSGMLDEISKVFDGAVKKPKGSGLSGIADQIKKITEKIAPIPTGLIDTPGFPGGGVGGGAVGAVASAASRAAQAAAAAAGGMAGGYGGKTGMPGYGGKTGQAGYGGAGYGGGGYGGKAGGALPGGGMGAAGGAVGGLATAAQKAIFIATLQKIIQDVAEKPNFDMNRAINDVWMQVSMLRSQKAMKDMTEAFHMMESAMKAQHDMAKNVIGNIR